MLDAHAQFHREEGCGELVGRQVTERTLRVGFAGPVAPEAAQGVVVLIAVAGVALTGPITVGVPWLASQQFGASAAAFGLMLSMWAAGSLLGALTAGACREVPGARTLSAAVVVVLAGGLLALGFAGRVAIVAVALLVMGAVAGFFNVVMLTWLQQRALPGHLGRVMSVVELAEVVTTPASYLLAGVMLDVSAAAPFSVAAGVLLAGGAWIVVSGRARPCRPGFVGGAV